MEEQKELIQYAQEGLTTAQKQNNEAEAYFYAKVLELYQSDSGFFWALLLRHIRLTA